MRHATPVCRIIAPILLLTGPGPAAFAVSVEPAVLEEVIVTAQKRSQALQDVPVAVTVVRGDDIEATQTRDLRDLQHLTTSLVVAQADSSSQLSFSIRGLSTNGYNAGLESAVGVVVDGVYRGRQVEAVDDLLDVEQVEVLRGPQSTLFGKNTTAGVISIRTREPAFETSGYAQLTLGNYNARVVGVGFNAPLVDNVAAVRFDGSANWRDGFVDNLGNAQRLNDRSRNSVRGQLLVRPTSDLSIRVIADVASLHEHCCAAPFYYWDPGNAALVTSLGGTVLPTDPYARRVYTDARTYSRELNGGLSAEVDWTLPTVQLTSITSFRYYDQYDSTDTDYTNLSLVALNASASITRSFSEELRLASRGNQRVDWLGGLYYFNQHLTSGGPDIYGADLRGFADTLAGGYVSVLESLLELPAGTFFAAGQGLINEHYVQNGSTSAAFGNVDFHATEHLTLTGGLRYETAKKHVVSDIVINDPFAALDLSSVLGGAFAALQPLQFFPPVANFDKSFTESDVSGKATITYAPVRALTGYASYAHGVKAGGFNLSTTASESGFSFRPEKVDAYELGLKTRAWNNRMTTNLAFFDEEVRDYQADVFNGVAFILQNAGRIRLRGAELEWVAHVDRALTVEAGATYLLGTIETFPDGPCPLAATTPACDLAGKRVPDAPRWTLAGSATYEWPLSGSLTGFARAGAHLRTSRYVMLSNEPRSLMPTTTDVDASLGVRGSGGGWEVALWGRNITNAHYAQTMFNSVALAGNLSGFPNDPATYGITARARF